MAKNETAPPETKPRRILKRVDSDSHPDLDWDSIPLETIDGVPTRVLDARLAECRHVKTRFDMKARTIVRPMSSGDTFRTVDKDGVIAQSEHAGLWLAERFHGVFGDLREGTHVQILRTEVMKGKQVEIRYSAGVDA